MSSLRGEYIYIYSLGVFFPWGHVSSIWWLLARCLEYSYRTVRFTRLRQPLNCDIHMNASQQSTLERTYFTTFTRYTTTHVHGVTTTNLPWRTPNLYGYTIRYWSDNIHRHVTIYDMLLYIAVLTYPAVHSYMLAETGIGVVFAAVTNFRSLTWVVELHTYWLDLWWAPLGFHE